MSAQREMDGKHRVMYVSSYTDKLDRGSPASCGGIQTVLLDLYTGAMEKIGAAINAGPNPSYLAAHHDQPVLYAINETMDEKCTSENTSTVRSFLIEGPKLDARLRCVGKVDLKEHGACHVITDQMASHLFVCNYLSGSVSVVELNDQGEVTRVTDTHRHTEASNGVPTRQSTPHAHGATMHASNLYVCDLGCDKIFQYVYDKAEGTISLNKDDEYCEVPKCSGPRHLVFHPTLPIAYCVAELSSEVLVLDWDVHSGCLTMRDRVSALPPTGVHDTNTPAAIRVHPNGLFVYVTNRGHDSVAVFDVNTDTGDLKSRGHVSTRGYTPREMVVDDSGTFLIVANQHSDELVSFEINQDTGVPQQTGQTLSINSPVCICFPHY